MGILDWFGTSGAGWAVAGVALVLLIVCVLGWVRTARTRRTARTHRERLDAELARSRATVEQLDQRVAQLAEEVAQARGAATQRDREYVITSLGDVQAGGHTALPGQRHRAPLPTAGKVVEQHLVDALARQHGSSPLRTRAAGLAVRTLAVGHGVRRAFSAEVLDRAAAESHLARRRSRRQRRREVREARRLVRAVRAHRAAGEDAA